MANNIKKLAELMGAQIMGTLPDVGGGAFGAAVWLKCIERERSNCANNKPTELPWSHRPNSVRDR